MSQPVSAGHTSTLPVSQSRTTVLGPPGNHGNYQNCIIVQSHQPPSGYRDTSLPPKTVIFPFFVQPLDLCSPVRTLRMSEEMILHQADLLPYKVSVLIFSDLLLLAREDDGGRCTVLRRPLYLNALRLREVPWEPLRLHLLQRSAGCWRRIFSLEAFDAEQKVRVGLCLQDDRRRCLVAMETMLPWQLSDFGLLCRPSSPFSSRCSPVFPGGPAHPTPSDPPSQRQQGEGQSSSEVSDPGGLRLRPPISQEEEEEEERGCRRPVLRRSFSEGSLLQEARLPHFLSDSTIHHLRPTSTFDPTLPLPSRLPQLTKEGASLHHMLLLLNGAKEGKSSNFRLKAKNTKSLPSEGEVMRWAYSLEALLTNQYGVAVFRDFLRSEFSEENLDFWLAVEKFKRTPSLSKMTTQARRIYDQFLSPCAARKVNVDSTNHSLSLGVNPASFQRAQDQIFSLMEADSYPRFLKSHLNAQLANHNTGTAVELSNQTNQSVID
ncbi:regulator of G-protein signaling 3-like [Xiphophorus couchianus]|uniref:regulator of G-protein signaling 3-like n=1 Tax=Xiphophorus couchianus TaxID=32473 RepID=UPI00101616A2|nr:regulator of G-protein signaling 3-like [Xiphophorus couchianus]